MTALTALMTCFYAGEDNWLARRSNSASVSGTSKIRDGNGKPRRSKHNSRNEPANHTNRSRDTTVNAGFSNPKPGQRKRPFKANGEGPSNLDRTLDQPCEIHGHPNKPDNHTNRNCWVLKQAGKLNAKHKGRGPPGNRDDGVVHQPNTGGQKQFHPEDRSIPEHKYQFGFLYPPHIPAKFVPRIHQYTLKIPWALAEAQYGQACKHSRNIFHLLSFFLFIIS